MLEITLIREDKKNLACASDRSFGEIRCAHARDGKFLGRNPDGQPEHPAALQHRQERALPGGGAVASAGLERAAAHRALHGRVQLPRGRGAQGGGAALVADRHVSVRSTKAWRSARSAIALFPNDVADAAGLPGAVRRKLDAERGRSWAAMSAPERFVTVCLGGHDRRRRLDSHPGLPWPTWFTFDEEPFVKNAHNYALGLPDNNDHPPFGKLLHLARHAHLRLQLARLALRAAALRTADHAARLLAGTADLRQQARGLDGRRLRRGRRFLHFLFPLRPARRDDGFASCCGAWSPRRRRAPGRA